MESEFDRTVEDLCKDDLNRPYTYKPTPEEIEFFKVQYQRAFVAKFGSTMDCYLASIHDSTSEKWVEVGLHVRRHGRSMSRISWKTVFCGDHYTSRLYDLMSKRPDYQQICEEIETVENRDPMIWTVKHIRPGDKTRKELEGIIEAQLSWIELSKDVANTTLKVNSVQFVLRDESRSLQNLCRSAGSSLKPKVK